MEKIAILNKFPPYPMSFGGSEKFIAEIAKRVDYEVHVFCFPPERGNKEPAPENCTLHFIPPAKGFHQHIHFDLGYSSSLIYYSYCMFFLKRELQALRPQIVYDFISPLPSTPILASKIPDTTYIAQIWAFTLGLRIDIPKYLASIAYRNINHYNFDGHFFASARLLNAFSSFGFASDRSFVIKQGVDVSKFAFKPDKNPNIIMSSGRLVKQKGHEYLIHAMPQILEERPDSKLIIAGSGPLRGQLQKQIDSLKLRESVKLLGYVNEDQYVELVRSAQCFVVPSLIEAIPLTALEAMACGTPVISTDALGVSDLFTSEFDALVVKARDSSEIASACLRLFSDSKLCRSLSANSSSLIRNKYTWDLAADSVAQAMGQVQSASVRK